MRPELKPGLSDNKADMLGENIQEIAAHLYSAPVETVGPETEFSTLTPDPFGAMEIMVRVGEKYGFYDFYEKTLEEITSIGGLTEFIRNGGRLPSEIQIEADSEAEFNAA